METSRILSVIAGVMVLPASLLALGTLVNGIPVLGTAGLWIFPVAAGQFIPVALCGTAVAVAAVRRGARRSGRVFAVIGMLTAVSAGTVLARHARIATANGVSVSLFATVVPRPTSVGAEPDETVVYTQVHGQDLKLDIYRPKGNAGVLAPVLVHIHGGGWIAGDRKAKAANLRWFADNGYLGVSLDYVLATAANATWNTAASQVACGLSWIAANAAKYGGNPRRLFAFGESAGGAIALTTTYATAAGTVVSSCGGDVPAVRAVSAQVPGLDPVTLYENSDPIEGRRSRRMVRAYLGGTPEDHPDRVRAVSSVTYITMNAPPTLLLLSDNDRLVPIEGALQFIDRAKQAGISLRIVRFPWAGHNAGALYYSVVNQAWLQIVRQHFCRYGGNC